jgi:hypothetical protein
VNLNDIKDPKLRERILEAYRAQNSPRPARVQDAKQCEQPIALERCGVAKAQGSKRPLVRFSLFRVRLLDVDAKYASTKDLLDGLAAAGLVDGDKEGQVRLEVEQVRVGSYKEEKTEIEIIYDL